MSLNSEASPLVIDNFVQVIPDNDVLGHAMRDHEAAGHKFTEYMVHFLSSPVCYVVKTPLTFLMLIENVPEKRWHVHYAYNATHLPALDTFLTQMPFWLEHVSWARPLKNRQLALHVYPTRRLFQIANLNPELVPGFPG